MLTARWVIENWDFLLGSFVVVFFSLSVSESLPELELPLPEELPEVSDEELPEELEDANAASIHA